MFDPKYIDDASDSYYCYDNTYNDNATYSGFFEQGEWYEFQGGKFVTTIDPGSCDNYTGYVCVSIDTSVVPHILTQFRATGKFLNWLSASKFDIEKQILTGGKYDGAAQAVIGESRGCYGRPFVKEVPVAGFNATFTVRGPEPRICEVDGSSCEIDADCPSGSCIVDILDVSDGGLTEIEIWSGNYDQQACQDAIDEATSGSLGQLKKAIDDCLEAGPGPWGGGHGQDTIDQNAAFNQSIQTCWHGSTQNWGHSTSLSNQCDKIYDAGTDPHDIPLTSRAAVCSYAYIGLCWEEDIHGEGPHDWPADDQCYQDQMDLWCHSFEFPDVTDPSVTDPETQTEEHGNIPGMLWHSAVESQLGEPIGTFPVYVDTAVPSGLIQDFAGRIRFGVMAFNHLGSWTECTYFPSPGELGYNDYAQINFACEEIGASDKDGAQVLARIGSDIPTILNTINNLRGETWTPFAEGFFNAIAYFTQNINDNNLPYRLNATDFDTTEDPCQVDCQSNNVLLISDGQSTTDLHARVIDFVGSSGTLGKYYEDDGEHTGDAHLDDHYDVVPLYWGSKNLDDLSYYAQHFNIFDPEDYPLLEKQTIKTYVIYTGLACDDTAAPIGVCDGGEDDAEQLMRETALNGGGDFYPAESYEALETALRQSFQSIAARAASGTAASVLASGEGSGANLVQAIFFPINDFSGTEITWTGMMKNLWYHIDPLLGNSSIREDSADYGTLHLVNDHIILFHPNATGTETWAELWVDSDGDGIKNTVFDDVKFDMIHGLWEAGELLHQMPVADRDIFTTTGGTSKIDFDTTNAATLMSQLRAENSDVANRIIEYVRGTDFNAKFCSFSFNDPCTQDSDCPDFAIGEECIRYRNRTVTYGGTTDTWKLGDIVNSTPRIVSWVPLNTYDKTYNDITYTQFIKSDKYTDRGMVFVGANDGMLHAFRLGTLELFEERNVKAKLSGADLGKEEWAFIPKNSLPYLRYMAETDYCHIYFADATPYMFDASIGSGGAGYENDKRDVDSWRTILIGGMRQGGACKNSCTGDINDDGAYNALDCIETPENDKGYSSYFALDITESGPGYPKVLWEFSHEDLGFSTTGPAIVRISGETGGFPDNTTNGKWFVVFGSGPTGPIDSETHQFRGYSDQPLKIFILNLADGTLEDTIDAQVELGNDFEYAFVGSMIDAAIDFDQNDPASSSYYQDDALYFGFVRSEDANPDYDKPVNPTKWNTGGVLRLFTNNSLNAGDWELSRMINTGPVTSAVSKLQNYTDKEVFLFWGTGRYYYKISDDVDDATHIRALYGVKEPCYDTGGIDFNCDALVNRAALYDASTDPSPDPDIVDAAGGWYIILDDCTDADGNIVACAGADFMTERNVTDPLATPIGAVFFTTTKPTADVCAYGGDSHLWAVDYDTGGQVSSSVLRGQAVMQVSTGEIKEVNLKTDFTERQGRRTQAYTGVPPSGTPPGILIPPKPINKYIHIYER